MLCTNTYPEEYVARCEARVAAQVAAYRALAKTAGGKAVAPFEHMFFNALVLTLDTYFVHRSRTIEGKDGNALNEVRLLGNSLVSNDGVLTLDAPDAAWNATLKSDKTIKYVPERAVLGYKPGDPIRLTESEFALLAAAYFAAIRERFG